MLVINFFKVIKYIFIISLLLLSLDTIVLAKIITYMDYCNKTFTMGEINDVHAGIINFKYSRPVGNTDTFICVVQIVTTPGSQISATFTDASTLSNEWGTSRSCGYSIILSDKLYQRQYCSSVPREEVISTNSYLSMIFQSTGSANVSFKMIFNAFSYCRKQGQRDGMCNNGRCIDQSLVCTNEDNFCRDDTELCGSGRDSVTTGLSVSTTGRDSVKPEQIVSAISVIVFIVIGIIMILTIVYAIFRIRKLSRQSNLPVVRTAADVFVVRITDEPDGGNVSPNTPRTFGLPPEYGSLENLDGSDGLVVRTSDDPGGGNVSPTDLRTFNPPPEYSSLENLAGSDDTREDVYTTIAKKPEDLPPDYQAVLANTTEYKVTQHI